MCWIFDYLIKICNLLGGNGGYESNGKYIYDNKNEHKSIENK